MSERIDLARSWFQVANEDILTADQLMQYEDPVLRSVCFHCQQAVEKYIKGLIIYLDGDFSYTHDISRLLDELRKYEKDLSLEDLEPDQLTSYAVEACYPEPENSLSIERAREAVSIAHQVRNRILEKLNI